MALFLIKIREFESDCEDWDSRYPDAKILPEKIAAIDDNSVLADRPERDLIKILDEMPKSTLKIVSPKSKSLKLWLKAPMLIFVNLAAMTSSISELFMKVAGCILKDAESWSDYLWLFLFAPILAYTATRTLVYVNFGIKYYEQMVVMPIYQTCLLNHNILIGFLSLNEIKHYSSI